MRAGIFNPFTPIPKNDKSHVKGWSKVWASHLSADILHKGDSIFNYDTLYIDHGVNFEGSLNLFGGLSSEVYERLDALNDFLSNSSIISLDHDIKSIDYLTQIEKRLDAKSTDKRITPKLLKSLRKKGLFSCKRLTYDHLDLDSAIIGDSHSTAFASAFDRVYRVNGKTMYSVTNCGIDKYIKRYDLCGIDNLTLCFGSIDVRFHADLNKKDFEKLIINYCEQIQTLDFNTFVSIPLPIESEERKIPKSGFYKGKPFYGSRQERIGYLELMKEILEYFNLSIVHPPKKWYTLDPKTFEAEYMEFGGSVHLSPIHYRIFSGEYWHVYDN